MKSDRWEQIETLLHSALACEAHKRAEFLDHACGADADLRNELESLLACSPEAEDFLKSPALEDTAIMIDNSGASSPGQRIGPYSVLAQLGAGGMGEVYLAQDSRLGRRVALKTLPPFFVKDEQRLLRFEHEARAASGLNHPNIVTIHEIGMSDGLYFIAMEHIDGETLRSVMNKGRLATGELLEVAIQVASALAAAHTAGIVHRDIKPENLMLRPDGYLKVLDFGLAKLVEHPVTGSALRPGSMTSEAGVVVGTARYMSPEQARGLGVDERTDLFSLGVVLYEMIAGHAPFEGATNSDVIAAILRNQPPALSSERAGIPELERIVMRALQKDKETRYQTSAEMLVELRHLKRELEYRARQEDSGSVESVKDGAATRGPAVETADELSFPTNETPARTTSGAELLIGSIKRHKRVMIVALAMSAIAVAASGYALYRMLGTGRGKMPFQEMRMNALTGSGKVLQARISPDGKYMVYSIDDGDAQSLWLKEVEAAGSDKQLVPPAEARYLGATFSPDGDFVYYVISESTHNGLFRVAVHGGASEPVMDNVASAISFSPDGRQFAFLRSKGPYMGTSLMIAREDDTEEKELADGDLGPPAWSPDGKTIVCVLLNYNIVAPTPLMAVQVDGQQRVIDNKRVAVGGQLAWLGDSSALVAAGTEQASIETQLWLISYPAGEIKRITNDLKDYRNPSVTADGASIVTVQSEQLSNIWIAQSGDAKRARRITLGNQDTARALCWTPDGGRIVYESNESGRVSLWVAERDGSNKRPLVDNGSRPTVSPDGRYVLFSSTRAGSQNIWRVDLGGGNLKRLTKGVADGLPYCSLDSQWVVYTAHPRSSLWRVSIEGGEATQITQKWTRGAVIAPGGKLMACWYRPDVARPNSQPNIAILSSEGGDPIDVFPLGRSARPPISPPNSLRWAPDGRSVLYIDTRESISNIWSQPLDKSAPKQVTDFKTDRIFFFDWSPDGKQLALIRGTLNSDAILITGIK